MNFNSAQTFEYNRTFACPGDLVKCGKIIVTTSRTKLRCDKCSADRKKRLSYEFTEKQKKNKSKVV